MLVDIPSRSSAQTLQKNPPPNASGGAHGELRSPLPLSLRPQNFQSWKIRAKFLACQNPSVAEALAWHKCATAAVLGHATEMVVGYS
jgi:hypothetical protein